MWNPRLFLTTRGKVLLLLRKEGSCTVAYLSHQLQVTPNAIRQHLSSLERDYLVIQQPVRTGARKPAMGYFLTDRAEPLFPNRYGGLLLECVEGLLAKKGSSQVCDFLANLGRSAAEGYLDRLAGVPAEELLREVKRIMEERGSLVEMEEADGEIVVRDFNCPHAAVTRVHPEVCQVQRAFLQRLLGSTGVEIACDRQKAHCGFLIQLP